MGSKPPQSGDPWERWQASRYFAKVMRQFPWAFRTSEKAPARHTSATARDDLSLGVHSPPPPSTPDSQPDIRYILWLVVGLAFIGYGVTALYQLYTAPPPGGTGWIPLSLALISVVAGAYIVLAVLLNLWLPKPRMDRMRHHGKVSVGVLIFLMIVATIIGLKFPRNSVEKRDQASKTILGVDRPRASAPKPQRTTKRIVHAPKAAPSPVSQIAPTRTVMMVPVPPPTVIPKIAVATPRPKPASAHPALTPNPTPVPTGTPTPSPTLRVAGSVLSAGRLLVQPDPGHLYIFAVVSIPSSLSTQMLGPTVTISVNGKTYVGEPRNMESLDLNCGEGLTMRYTRADFIYDRVFQPGRLLQGVLIERFSDLDPNTPVDFTTMRIAFSEAYGSSYVIAPVATAAGIPCGFTAGLGTVVTK